MAAYTTSSAGNGKVVLILGAGMVVRPMVHYLAGHGYRVIVASRTVEKAQELSAGAPNVSTQKFDIESADADSTLDQLIPPTHAVVSMLPYLHHVQVARKALQHGKHFFTTSYVSDAMRELNQEAISKGLVFINECGVDPGTDHMSAMQIIDEVTAKGGKIVSFSSYCGGLPAPDNNNNPFGYKFSWSPRGVLLAGRNDAKFLEDGKEVVIPGPVLFDNFGRTYIDELGSEFETYPNRNSLQYIDLYGLHHTRKMVRGTFRNKGWCQSIKKLVELKLLDLTERSFDDGTTYVDLVREVVGSSEKGKELKEATDKFLNLNETNRFVLDNFEWLGLFEEGLKVPKAKTTLDALCDLFQKKLSFAPGERDMLLMKHEFIAEYADGKTESIDCTLVDYGIPNGDSSMSRTVSLPVAISLRLVLEGQFVEPGLQIPSIPQLYEPILKELALLGIEFKHKTRQT
eukprot:TRINITY_DN4416_c0_g1_i1.p1 TRINITY_DN4416_c0_g1~~TRINITY_DN4416_c0_g1_i1.p1  ORF type:complete len:467 (+),score=109.95 TRINITY_DN4416_c0_g1_i1:29-1402(+)